MNTHDSATSSIRDKHFPVSIGDYTIHSASPDELSSFSESNYDAVFPSRRDTPYFNPSGGRRDQIRKRQKAYRIIHHEWFLVKHSPTDATVGWAMGEAEDSVTFYMRNTGILPEHQNKGIYSTYTQALIKYLTELGYERITSHHKATNRRILATKLKLGFDIAGIEFTENWGPLVKLVLLTAPDRKVSFDGLYG